MLKAAGNVCTWSWISELCSATMLWGAAASFSLCRAGVGPCVYCPVLGTMHGLFFSFQVAGDRELIWEGRGKRSLKELIGNQNEVKQVGASPAVAGGVEAKHARGNALRLPEIYCSLGQFS